MEEKKSIKISLKTYLISMFLMLLVIGILLGYILQTGEKINKEIAGKNDNKNIEESVVEDEKVETENSNEENVIETEAENKIDKSFSAIIEELKKEDITDNEIKNTLESYLNIFYGYGAPEQLLNSLDLMSYEEAQNYTADDDNYKITDIPYVEFEKKIKQYTTIENFEKLNTDNKFVDIQFKNVDGNVAYFDGGWTGTEYVVDSVTIKGDYSETRYVANYHTIEGEATSEKTTLEFDIEKDNDNGNCIISNCYFE